MVANRDETRALATRAVAPEEWGIMLQQGEMLVKTGFLPESIKTKEQAVAIMLKGRELNIPAMYALSNIAIIKGKPVAGAELLLALIYRDHGDGAVLFSRSDAGVCTVEYQRRNWSQRQNFSFTLEDARRAKLNSKEVWQQYPAAMLRARCISAVARMAFPDSIAGMYTPEEMGAEVTITDQDEIVIHQSPTVQEMAEAPLKREPKPRLRDVDHETGEVLENEPMPDGPNGAIDSPVIESEAAAAEEAEVNEFDSLLGAIQAMKRVSDVARVGNAIQASGLAKKPKAELTQAMNEKKAELSR